MLARGVFGAPAYAYKNELFRGRDRLEFLDRAPPATGKLPGCQSAGPSRAARTLRARSSLRNGLGSNSARLSSQPLRRIASSV